LSTGVSPEMDSPEVIPATTVMVIVGSVRPGRVGLPVAEWARDLLEADERFEVDFVDLAQLGLPFMDEPNHPRLRQYTQPHTLAWSERVEAADAFIFVVPEYNHGYSPVVKNAIDFLYQEWNHKPAGLISYGGASSGTRGVTALKPVLAAVGLVPPRTNVEIPFVAKQITDQGAFEAVEHQDRGIQAMLDDIEKLAPVLRALRTSETVASR